MKALFMRKRKLNRRNKAVVGSMASDQLEKMGKLGQQLVVMSR